MSIIRINEFQAVAHKASELRDFLASIIHSVAEAPGCQRCELAADLEDPTRFVIIEKWDSVEAHREAAARIPPELLGAFRSLIARPPMGRYHEQL